MDTVQEQGKQLQLVQATSHAREQELVGQLTRLHQMLKMMEGQMAQQVTIHTAESQALMAQRQPAESAAQMALVTTGENEARAREAVDNVLSAMKQQREQSERKIAGVSTELQTAQAQALVQRYPELGTQSLFQPVDFDQYFFYFAKICERFFHGPSLCSIDNICY